MWVAMVAALQSHAMIACVLQTPRLVLREMTLDDAPFILEALNQPSFIEQIGDRGVRDLDGARTYLQERVLAHYARHGFGLWLMALQGTGEAVGMCGLIKRDSLDDADIGYALLERHWGQGYAREAAEAVLRHALQVLKLPRVVAITAPDNERSMGLLRSIGLRFVDRRPLPEGESAYFTT